MSSHQKDNDDSSGDPLRRDQERRQDLPGHDTGSTRQIARSDEDSPGASDGTGDSSEREPNQRPHDFDLHQCTHLNGRGIKGEKEEQLRREQANA